MVYAPSIVAGVFWGGIFLLVCFFTGLFLNFEGSGFSWLLAAFLPLAVGLATGLFCRFADGWVRFEGWTNRKAALVLGFAPITVIGVLFFCQGHPLNQLMAMKVLIWVLAATAGFFLGTFSTGKNQKYYAPMLVAMLLASAVVSAQQSGGSMMVQVGSVEFAFSQGQTKEKRGRQMVEVFCSTAGAYDELALDLQTNGKSSGHPDRCNNKPFLLGVDEVTVVYLFLQENEDVFHNETFRFYWQGGRLVMAANGRQFVVTAEGLQPVVGEDG